MQQMLDLDIDSLATKIDHHHCKTKKAVLVRRLCWAVAPCNPHSTHCFARFLNRQEHFMETKARLMQAQNDAVDEERRKAAAKLAAKEVRATRARCAVRRL